MAIFSCPKCKKEFNRKSNFNYHIENKIRPCKIIIIDNDIKNYDDTPEYSSSAPEYSSSAPECSDILPKNTESTIEINNITLRDMLEHNIEKLINTNLKKKTHDNMCIYCETIFTRNTNLQRHLKDRCKSKKYYDELELIRKKLNIVIIENEHLKQELKNHNTQVVNNNNNTNNTLANQINNGTVNNNNVNIQLVQFGNENIDDLDIQEALNIYLKSTGGNILSNILKYVNLNEKYPENHNICITDLSRELVKIFNGKKFITKKFKNVKGDILGKVLNNTNKLVDKIENNKNIKMTSDIKSKMKINDI
jgi:hypothetical protein